jgi:RNA polymerase sigma-70 factor (ECF subfamily)
MGVPRPQKAGSSVAPPRATASVPPPRPPADDPPLVVGTTPEERRINVRALFDDHYDYVWRSLRRLGVKEADIDDAVQEVFVIVHRKLAEFASRSKVTTWLYGIAFRVSSEYHRRAYVRHEQPTSAVPDQVDQGLSPEERVQGREARAKLDEVLDALDVEKRAVFVLYEIDQLPVEHIAVMLEIPTGTVYSRLKTARQEFDKSLARMRAKWAHASRAGKSNAR